MESLTEFFKSIAALHGSFGALGTVILLLIGVGVLMLWSWWSDRGLKEAQRDLVREKEAQIQRLAEDNRMWRNYFFLKQGLTEDEVRNLRGSGSGPQHLNLPESDADVRMSKRRK